jgi:hypothetical protein
MIRLAGAAMILWAGVSAGLPCRADSELHTYAFGNLLVFDRFAENSARTLNFVVLDDSLELKAAGQLKIPGTHDVDAYADYKDYLIVLERDRVYACNVSDPAHPSLVVTLELADQGFSGTGWPQIVRTGASNFLLLSNSSAAELRVSDDARQWTVSNLERTPELRARMQAEPPHTAFARNTYREDHPAPMVLKETAHFKYVLDWQIVSRPATVVHRKYLWKVGKRSGRPVSHLLLGEQIETID